MHLKKIILRSKDPFEQAIADWAKNYAFSHLVFDGKQSLFDLVDAMVIIHADHNISRENKELREQMEKNHKPTQEIDINSTMTASISSFRFWLENNQPTNVLMVGNNKLVKTARFDNYFKKLATDLNQST